MESLALIREFLETRLGILPQEVVPDAVLGTLGVDSLMMLELVFECEDRFGITLDQNQKSPRTVGELVMLLDRLRKKNG